MADLEKDVNDDIIETPTDDTPQTPEYTPEEQAALERGWKPKDQWDGPEDEWKPAKVFNEIGELKDRVSSTERDLKKTHKVVQLMKEHHLNVRQSAFKEALETLKNERNRALEAQDFAKAEEIRDQIDEVKEKFTDTGRLPASVEKEIAAQPTEPDPEFYSFVNRNPWYKPNGANEMSKKADALGWAYKNENPDLTFKEIIGMVEKDIRKLFPEKFESPRSPVNEPGSRGASGGSGSRVKLTPEQLEVAKSFDMTPEQYAKELESYRGH